MTAFQTKTEPARAAVILPHWRGDGAARTSDARLEEGLGLAGAIGLDIAYSECVQLRAPSPATLLSGGKVEALATIVRDAQIEIVIISAALSPIQQRNLERALGAKVLDRTGLILEIFGARAQTSEGRLQVDLAQLSYQRSRLVRSWTHLERQRGGAGFLGGPGETQKESDRRAIDDKIVRIKSKLKDVRRTRGLQRARRKRSDTPVIALVGYTNAGKSTLFNRLSGSNALAKDMLFATLDPALRQIRLPSGRSAAISDTVGFISELPTQLVAAFQATLEEVAEADLILHVRDVSHADTNVQCSDVYAVLAELGVNDTSGHRIIEVLNKVDRLGDDDRKALCAGARAAKTLESGAPRAAISAVTGEGVDALLEFIDQTLADRAQIWEIAASRSDSELRAWLHRNAAMLDEDLLDDETALLRVALTDKDFGRMQAEFPNRFELTRVSRSADAADPRRAAGAPYA